MQGGEEGEGEEGEEGGRRGKGEREGEVFSMSGKRRQQNCRTIHTETHEGKTHSPKATSQEKIKPYTMALLIRLQSPLHMEMNPVGRLGS